MPSRSLLIAEPRTAVRPLRDKIGPGAIRRTLAVRLPKGLLSSENRYRSRAQPIPKVLGRPGLKGGRDTPECQNEKSPEQLTVHPLLGPQGHSAPFPANFRQEMGSTLPGAN